MPASHVIDWVLLDHTADRPVEVGDMVSVDAGGMPIYRVMALDGRDVWLGGARPPTPCPWTASAGEVRPPRRSG
jgi:hypothetical protein